MAEIPMPPPPPPLPPSLFAPPAPPQDASPSPQIGPGALTDLISGVMSPRETHLFSGAPGVGKSTLLAWMLKQILNGEPIFGYQTRVPAAVGIIATDRQWEGYAGTLKQLGITDRVKHMSFILDPAITGRRLRSMKKGEAAGEDRHSLFIECVGKLFGSAIPPRDALIIPDVLGYFLGGDIMDYDKVSSYMLDLNKYAWFNEVTIWGISHAGKQKGDKRASYSRPQDRIVGTTAQTGGAGATMYLASPSETDGEHTEFTWVPRKGPAQTFRLKWTSEGLLVPVSNEPIMVTEKGESLSDLEAQIMKKVPVPNAPDQFIPLEGLRVFGFSKTWFYEAIRSLCEKQALVERRFGKEKRVRRWIKEWDDPESLPKPQE